MHSDLYRLSELLRARDIRVSILSTGLLLKINANKIVRHLDDVIVSLDGPEQVHDQIRRTAGAFSALSEGVREIHCLDPAFPISARCTVQRANCSYLCETVRAARRLGLTSISYLAADLTSEAFNRPFRGTTRAKPQWPCNRKTSCISRVRCAGSPANGRVPVSFWKARTTRPYHPALPRSL